MKAWTGTLPVDLFDDGMIECSDYPDWACAFHTIKTAEYDRDILDELLESIPDEGILEPLTLRVWRGRRDGVIVQLSDGHHRVVALAELGIKKFPYRWYWHPRGERLRLRFEQEPLPDWIIEGISS